ncbi:MAG: hypothetical protein AVDCRST_MAG30-2886 [uncultured Solirubrobacteraceae bacterium]|uniref:Saccharopine dehydrogenase NADP binding domain-containing protein n=1 Tax=uncultured Solirubrobacteraceae bacterium TaxID=1162706 RepID=A0A6J4TAE7_9ACTN|nr:MAG: hypothetical protein AVDCRST_MAG30-2886 [uncultured Solirubrobacteraceae bacterium]
MSGQVVVIGAGGDMCSVAVRRLAAHAPGVGLILTDLRPEPVQRLAASLGPGRATVGTLDLFDARALRERIRGAALVILGAGPFMRTAEPVLEACIAEGVDYLDFDDDTASTDAALARDGAVRRAGIAAYIGAGASPGLTNVMARDAASQLDELDTLDVAWCSGDEGPKGHAPAVIEHLVHAFGGPVPSWRDGRRVDVEAFADSEIVDLGGDLGPFRLYECGHPESVTLPRRYPDARRIRVLGGFHPQPTNGMVRGVSAAVIDGRLTMREAVEFFTDVLQDGSGTPRGWRWALRGIAGQALRREESVRSIAGFLGQGLRKQHPAWRGGIVCRATGRIDGAPASVVRRFACPSGGRTWTSMAAVTGHCVAAFAVLALEGRGTEAGVLCPEDWVEPQALYAAMQRLGAAPSDLVESPEQLPRVAAAGARADGPTSTGRPAGAPAVSPL